MVGQDVVMDGSEMWAVTNDSITRQRNYTLPNHMGDGAFIYPSLPRRDAT